MNLDDVTQYAITPALSLLPERMDTPAARAMLIAIGLQESRFAHRRQIRGPARGYWQFEQGGGVAGVLRHGATRALAESILQRFDYPADAAAVYTAIEHNDVVAAVFARLLLWTLPAPLPAGPADDAGAWAQYLDAWRPGKPHPGTWTGFYHQAWESVSC